MYKIPPGGGRGVYSQLKAYKEERDCLEKSVERVLYAEGIFTVCDINLKVLNGCISDISRQGQNDLVGALAPYVKSTKRFF